MKLFIEKLIIIIIMMNTQIAHERIIHSEINCTGAGENSKWCVVSTLGTSVVYKMQMLLSYSYISGLK